MSQETNPFRLSMLRRSESPFEPDNASGELYAPQQRVTEAPRPPPTRNPFRIDLSEPVEPTRESTFLEPPSYYESETRRHSDPNVVSRRGSDDDEKSRLAIDDRYREGYEEGMRIAREREREKRRQIRERHMRQSNGASSSNNGEHRSHQSSRQRSDRGESSSSRNGRGRSKSESTGRSKEKKKYKPGTSLDVIDKMDVTGFYGGASFGGFHHDGPFDAAAPHRNKTALRGTAGATPISAFPADGPNNSLAVEDPALAAYRKEESVYGRELQDRPSEAMQNSFDPTERGPPVHGARTLGLGTSTFIDGTPASQDAIARERIQSPNLGRSRSLLRRQPSTRRDWNDEEDPQPKSLLSRVRSLRVSRN